MHYVGVVSQHPSPNVSWLHALCSYASIYHWWNLNVGESNDSYSVCRDNVVMSQTVAFASCQFMVVKTIRMLQLICLSLSGVFCLIFYTKNWSWNGIHTTPFPVAWIWSTLLVEEWKTNLMSLAILFHFLCAQHAGFEWCSFCRLQPAKRAPLNTSRTKSPTHNELRTRRPMW